MKKYLLGIDIGTSSCKVAVFEASGKLCASASEEYELFRPERGFAEQSPEDWWWATCKALNTIFDKSDVRADEIAAVGVAAQSWACVAVDSEGNALCRAPIWMDTRAEGICADLRQSIDESEIFKICGNPLSPTYTTAKVLWMKQNLPSAYEKTCKILQANSYIVLRLTGKMTQDISQGYGWHCFDVNKLGWDTDIARLLGIDTHLLPEVYPCDSVVGSVTEQASRLTGLVSGTPVVTGGLDAACATLGVGVIENGQTQEQGGQAGGMSICLDKPYSDMRLILSPHVVPNRWLLQGGTVGGGGVMRWLDRELGEHGLESGTNSFNRLNELAASVAPGSDGLIFLPYMAGERTPIWDPDAKGVYYGLDYTKTRAHLIRAGMEGVAYSLRHNLEIAETAGATVNCLVASGGSANSSLWNQIKADVTGKILTVTASEAATTRGAAILAGVGVGMFDSYTQAIIQDKTQPVVYYPDPAAKKVYGESYLRYLELYPRLKGL